MDICTYTLYICIFNMIGLLKELIIFCITNLAILYISARQYLTNNTKRGNQTWV